jgi:hypothetical protein
MSAAAMVPRRRAMRSWQLRTIPIAYLTAGDTVAMGLLASINRPSGNVRGMGLIGLAFEAGRLELPHELVRKTSTIAVHMKCPDSDRLPKRMRIWRPNSIE